jgi:hypothetical protein
MAEAESEWPSAGLPVTAPARAEPGLQDGDQRPRRVRGPVQVHSGGDRPAARQRHLHLDADHVPDQDGFVEGDHGDYPLDGWHPLAEQEREATREQFRRFLARQGRPSRRA